MNLNNSVFHLNKHFNTYNANKFFKIDSRYLHNNHSRQLNSLLHNSNKL